MEKRAVVVILSVAGLFILLTILAFVSQSGKPMRVSMGEGDCRGGIMVGRRMEKVRGSRMWKAKVDSMETLFRAALPNSTSTSTSTINGRALSIYAGTGHEVMALLRLGLGWEQCVGIDMVESPPFVIRGDAHSLPFPPNFFHLEVTSHLSDSLFPDLVLSEVYRTLHPGGLALLLTGNDDGALPLSLLTQHHHMELVISLALDLPGLPPRQLLFRKQH